MNSLSLIKKYGDEVDTQILSQYKKPDKFLWVNDNDRDMTPMRIDLPDCPAYHEIAGFGKPTKEQIWSPPKLPRRLKELQRKFETIDEIWDELTKHQDIYEQEIKFMRKMWYHRLNGYWFFNNGKPTYIDGWNYFYIAWWKIDVGLPKYRDRDRKFFLFARHIYNERRTFKFINDKGDAIRSEQSGYFDFIDAGGRVFY